jgi:hypothetical protein
MGGASLPRKAVAAFRSAGATDEMIEAARCIYVTLPRDTPGRSRKYKTPNEANHAYYWRHRDRILKLEAIRRKRKKRALESDEPTHALTLEEVKAIHNPLPRDYVEAVGRTLIGSEMLPPADRLTMAVAETIVAALPDTGARVPSLKGLLVNAANWNVDRDADVEPIRALLDQGCDLEADVVPTVAGTVPELPRPQGSRSGSLWCPVGALRTGA